eukprot:238562-Prymnesium_polylepis.2
MCGDEALAGGPASKDADAAKGLQLLVTSCTTYWPRHSGWGRLTVVAPSPLASSRHCQATAAAVHESESLEP